MLKIESHKLKRKLTPTTNPFLSLARSIIYQQISTRAGDSIHAKFIKLFDKKKPSPKSFLQFSLVQLKQVGISPQKQKYLKDLAEKFLDKTLEPKRFPSMTNIELTEHLTQVKGIGNWTADMFLIFALNRQDVLPIGDLGIQKGFQKVFKLKKLPSEKRMIELSRPHRHELTNLSLYLWESLEKS
jgi:DNA-3-methyladenine glycosylase II